MDAASKRAARSAAKKFAAVKLTALEQRAYTQEQREREAELAESGRRACPKQWLLESLQTSTKVLHDQSDRWLLNARGKTIDLGDFMRRLYGLVNRNSRMIDREFADESEMSAQDRLATVRADMVSLQLEQLSGKLRSVDEVQDCWTMIAAHVRKAGEAMQRAGTVGECHAILTEALDDADRELAALLDDAD